MLHKMRELRKRRYPDKEIYGQYGLIHHNTRLNIRKALLPPLHAFSVFLGLLTVPVFSGS